MTGTMVLTAVYAKDIPGELAYYSKVINTNLCQKDLELTLGNKHVGISPLSGTVRLIAMADTIGPLKKSFFEN